MSTLENSPIDNHQRNIFEFEEKKRTDSIESLKNGSDKMGPFQTFAALCKGYCAINILILPKQFENGGWLVGIVSIFASVLFVLTCALKLVKCGQKL
jgi:hypothetical protein